ncbi:MAG: copper homeostasis protein CutC [Phycisphaerae bacterium]|nr:copper homeostasis protein CutC [Saprospiraceae bacterium]
MKFEVCAVNIQSALAAQRAGADRIELCSALDAGGLTPSLGLIRAAIRALVIPVHVLVRPREGDFCYSDPELEIMLDDIRLCREAGAAGVVVGTLTEEGLLDLPKMKAMKAAAESLEVTCHRAFDFTPDPAEALEQLIEMGFGRVLSSGQSDSAFEGRLLLQKLVFQANNRIAVMPGAGINAENIKAITAISGAKDFHFTGKKKVSAKGGNDIPGLEPWHWESDEEAIRAIILAGSHNSSLHRS